MLQANQTCPSCFQNTAFSVENDMSLGPRVQDEADLAAQVMRADLFNTIAKATPQELNLVRAVIPVIHIFRLVYPGTGQFGASGHSIALQSNNSKVAYDMPRRVSDTGLQLICDPGENYKKDPEVSRIFYARRALVVHLLKLLITQNYWYQSVYGYTYTFSQENVSSIPESGIPDGIPVLFEDKFSAAPSFVGDYNLSTTILSMWLNAGEDQPEDFPMASRAYAALQRDYNLDFDMHALASDAQENPRASPLQEMTKISQLVSFFLKTYGARVITSNVTTLPARPLSPPKKPGKNETAQQKSLRKSIAATQAAALKKWDPVDQVLYDELQNLRYLHAARAQTMSTKPSGFVNERSEAERSEADAKVALDLAGIKKTTSPPAGAPRLPKRGEATSERTQGLFSLMYPEIFATGRGDFNAQRKHEVHPRQLLEWVLFQDTSVFRDPSGWVPSAPHAATSSFGNLSAAIDHHISMGTAVRFSTAAQGARMKRPGTASGGRYARYCNAVTLRGALDSGALSAQYRGQTLDGATKFDLEYDYQHGLLLIGDGAGEVVASAPGINGNMPAMSSQKFMPHVLNMIARQEAMVQTTIFIRDELHYTMSAAQLKAAIENKGDALHSKILSYGRTLPGSPQEIKEGKALILAAYEELGPPCTFATQSFADLHDRYLHTFLVSFAGLAGTSRDPTALGLSPQEQYNRRAANLADYPVVVVWYWKARTQDFYDNINRKVLGFTHTVARAEFQQRGSEHTHALDWHPNKPPDEHLDTISEAARVICASDYEFDLHEMADIATAMSLYAASDGALEDDPNLQSLKSALAGHGMPVETDVTYDGVCEAYEMCKAATQWYSNMVDATAVLAQKHGETFTPPASHPSQGELQTLEKAADFDSQEADYHLLRHVTCRHTDCTGEYCQRTRKVNGKDENYCRFKESLTRRLAEPIKAEEAKSLPTHFYAVAAPLKGKDKEGAGDAPLIQSKEVTDGASEPLYDGCLRWRMYIARDDEAMNTTHPTQSRCSLANTDWKPTIDKWGLVNYVTKTAHYITKGEKETKGATGIFEAIAKEKEYDVTASVRSVLFKSVTRDMSFQELSGIALGHGPYRTNIEKATLTWSSNVRAVTGARSKQKGKDGGVHARFIDIEVYWHRLEIMRLQLEALQKGPASAAEVEAFQDKLDCASEMNAAQFQRHFGVVRLDRAQGQDEVECWRIHHRLKPSMVVVVIKPQLPDAFRRLPMLHLDHRRFCQMRLTTLMAVQDEAELLAYVAANGGTFPDAYRVFIDTTLDRGVHPDFDRAGRCALMDKVAFDGAEIADDPDSRRAAEREVFYDDDMDGGPGSLGGADDAPKCPPSTKMDAKHWTDHKASFGLDLTDEEWAKDWVTQVKTDPATVVTPLQSRAVPLTALNGEQRFAVSLLLTWYKAWAAVQFDGSLEPLPAPIHMLVYGAGGVGKSEVLKAVREAIDADLEARRQRPGAIIQGSLALTSADLVLVGAPTGAAAIAVGGSTINKLCGLGFNGNDDDGPFVDLKTGGVAAKALSKTFENAIFMFQDEIGMTSAEMFGKEDARMCQAKVSNANPHVGSFGDVNVILFGHHAQLPPVSGDRLYASVLKKPNEMASRGMDRYKQFTTVVVLREQMRQRAGDTTIAQREAMTKQERTELTAKKSRLKFFRSFLDRLCDSESTAEDWNWLSEHSKERRLDHASGGSFWDGKTTQYMFPTNKEQLVHNYRVLQSISGHPLVACYATHTGAGSSKDDKNAARGFCSEVPIAVTAQVSVVFNLWTEAGLANGTKGVVVGIIFPDGKSAADAQPLAILVQLDKKYRGPSFLQSTPRVVKFVPHVSEYYVKKAPASRTAFPVMLAFASTIHKAQGATYDAGVLDIGASEGKHPGKTYTAFSRFTDSLGLYCEHVPSLERLLWAKGADAKRELEARKNHEAALEQHAFQTIRAHARSLREALNAAPRAFLSVGGVPVIDRSGIAIVDPACAWAVLCASVLRRDAGCFVPLFWGPKVSPFKKGGRAVVIRDVFEWYKEVVRARRELDDMRRLIGTNKATRTQALRAWSKSEKARLTRTAAGAATANRTLQEQWTKKSAELDVQRDQETSDRVLVKKMRGYMGAGLFDMDPDDDSDMEDQTMAVHQGSNVHHFDCNMKSLTDDYGLFPFPGFGDAPRESTWSLPDGVTIRFDLFDYYNNTRLSKNWEVIKRWLESHGADVHLHFSTGRNQIGSSCGIVAARILTWVLQDGGAFRSTLSDAVTRGVLKGANTALHSEGFLRDAYVDSTKTKFLNETAINSLGCHYMKSEANTDPPANDPLRKWPFECTTIDQLLVRIARRFVAAKDSAQGGTFYYCTNTEATGHSGFHWVACVLTICVSAGMQQALILDSDEDL